MIKKLLFSITIVVLVSCTNQEQNNLPKCFDLKEYLEVNISYLDSVQPEISKKMNSKDTSFTLVQKELDWEEELSVFNNLDWSNKKILQYQIDSVEEGNKLKVKYTALDTTLEVQSLMIEKLKQLPDYSARLRVERRIDKGVYSIFQDLYFEPISGYYIKGSQKVPMMYDEGYNVFVSWNY